MTPTPINIFEYRVGNAPEGFWRYVYDPYPKGKPVSEATEEDGLAVFSAYRTPAPGTIPIYRHQYTYAEPGDPNSLRRYTAENERTPVVYELDHKPPSPHSALPTAPVDGYGAGGGVQLWHADAATRGSHQDRRVFWAFPTSSRDSGPAAVPVYEHRLEVDFTSDKPPGTAARPVLMPRCVVHVKYSISEDAGNVFAKHSDGRYLSAPSAEWWRTADGMNRYQQIPYAHARYTRKIAFYAFPVLR